MKCIYDLTTPCHKSCPEVECYNYDKVNAGVIDNEEPLKMIKFEEKDKCHWEDGCRADFFKELTAPYDVKTMQEFKAAIIDEFVELLKDKAFDCGKFDPYGCEGASGDDVVMLDDVIEVAEKYKAGDKE